jgi:hypothetical protein
MWHCDIKNATFVTLCGKLYIMPRVLFFNNFFFFDMHDIKFIILYNFHLDYIIKISKFVMKCNNENKTPLKLCN